MGKFAQHHFHPKNPDKYFGNHVPFYRSSWELMVMRMFDQHPNIIGWASEHIEIPYRHPGNYWTVYVPDFLVVYIDKNGNKYCELLEVKPLKETPGYQKISERTNKPLKMSQRDIETQAVNYAKWTAARAFCAKRGWTFRVITEESLFVGKKK